jgi:hypothetical protein
MNDATRDVLLRKEKQKETLCARQKINVFVFLMWI